MYSEPDIDEMLYRLTKPGWYGALNAAHILSNLLPAIQMTPHQERIARKVSLGLSQFKRLPALPLPTYEEVQLEMVGLPEGYLTGTRKVCKNGWNRAELTFKWDQACTVDMWFLNHPNWARDWSSVVTYFRIVL